MKRAQMLLQGHRAEHEQAKVREKMGLAKQASLQDQIMKREQELQMERTKGSSLKSQLSKQERDAANAARLAGARERSLGDKIKQQQQRIGGLFAEGNQLADTANKRIAKLTSDIDQNVGTIRSLRDALRRAQADLAAARAAARKSKDDNMMKEVDRLADQLKDAKMEIKQKAEAAPAPRAPAPAPAPRAPAPAAPPIVVQGGAGGGGASSSAGGSSASSGGGSGACSRACACAPS